MNLDFTPRNAAKYVANAAVHGIAANRVKHLADNHTGFDKDDTIIQIAAGLIGWYVSDKVRPYTDRMVDETADFIVAKREAYKSKKKDTPES